MLKGEDLKQDVLTMAHDLADGYWRGTATKSCTPRIGILSGLREGLHHQFSLRVDFKTEELER